MNFASVSCTSLFLLPVGTPPQMAMARIFRSHDEELRVVFPSSVQLNTFAIPRCDDIAVVFLFCSPSISCVSVFPESPRWQLATSQIPQVKWSLKEFTIRNQVCLLYGVAMTDSLLSGTWARTLTHAPTNFTNLLCTSVTQLQNVPTMLAWCHPGDPDIQFLFFFSFFNTGILHYK